MSWLKTLRGIFSAPPQPPSKPTRVFDDLTWQERVKAVQVRPEERFPVYSLAGPTSKGQDQNPSLSPAQKSSVRELQRQREAGIELVKFRFGQMAAGHCSFSRKMDGHRLPIGKAEPLPAASCEHPDQCGCRWQAWLDLMDEMGIE